MAAPKFFEYMVPVINALKELGNSGTPSEVRDIIAKDLQLPETVIDERLPSGESRFVNRVHWARFYLVKAGFLDSSQRGVWTLTDKALKSPFTEADILEICKQVDSQYSGPRSQETSANEETQGKEEKLAPPDSDHPATVDYRAEFLEIVRNMPPAAFERLCQRLLRESGFQQVEVTGRSGDGGIDGKGLLEINPLMSIHVVFQAKRYNGTVGSPEITQFRGAMTGRTDKGIFITTGTFTTSARKEATREGAPPIELVDSDKLLTMFENLQLGLKPKTVYEVDRDFFEDFL